MPALVPLSLEGQRVRILHGTYRGEESVILEITPSGLHVRLACDEPLPNGIHRWRRRESVELLDPYPFSRNASPRSLIDFLCDRPALTFPRTPDALPRFCTSPGRTRRELGKIIPFPQTPSTTLARAEAEPILVFEAD